MPDDIGDITQDIIDAATQPAEASTPQGTVKARSIDDMIKANEYARQIDYRADRRSGWAQLRKARFVPPASI